MQTQPSLSLTLSVSLFLPSEPHSLCADPTPSLSLSLSLSLNFFLLNHICSVQTQPSLTLSLFLSVSLCLSHFLLSPIHSVQTQPSFSLSLYFFLLKLCLYCSSYSNALVSWHFIHPGLHPPPPLHPPLPPFPAKATTTDGGPTLSWLKPHYIVPHLTLFLSPL